MAIAKIILNGVVQMDVTQDTVAANKMVSGITATDKTGNSIIGSLATKTSSDLSVSGATVTVPAGVYETQASASVASGSATTPATTITANPTISVNSSTGVITATNSKTQSVTPTVSAGYVSSGTAGTITVSGSNTSNLTTQSAQTIYPSTSDQTISSGKFLTGTQTVKGVLLTNLSAGNIKKDVVVKVGDSADDDRITAVTGTYEGGGGGGGLTAKTITGYGTASVTPTGWNITDLQTDWETPKVLGLVASDSLTGSPLTYYVDAPGNGDIYCLGSLTAPFDTIYEWIYLRFTYSRNIQTGAITSISLQEAGYYADNQLVEDMTEYIEDWKFTSIS